MPVTVVNWPNVPVGKTLPVQIGALGMPATSGESHSVALTVLTIF
jgi:hypothetical protein